MGGCGSKGTEDVGNYEEGSMVNDDAEGQDLSEPTWFKSMRGHRMSTKKLFSHMPEAAKDTSPKRRVHRGTIARPTLTKMWHGDIDECVRKIEQQADASSMLREQGEKTLLHASEMFQGDWLDSLRAIGSNCAEVGSSLDMVMIGDFGNADSALDDEKALTMAVAMKRIGLIGKLTVIGNLGNSSMRARLAKGTANALGAHDVRVGAGTNGGRKEDKTIDFGNCPYLAREDELDAKGATPQDPTANKLIFSALEDARDADPPRKVAFVLTSALTDMAEALKDPKWEEIAPVTVSHIVVMGGVLERPETLGLRWKDLGEERPAVGKMLDAEVVPPKLLDEFESLKDGERIVALKQADWEPIAIPGLKPDAYIYSEAKRRYFGPAPGKVIAMDPGANNNTFDYKSAKHVYDTLMTDPRYWFLVVTRHAVPECQLPRSAFDGSSHPVALRITSQARPKLQALWKRVHLTEIERLLLGDGLPMDRNESWFRQLNLELSAPPLGKDDDVWPYIKGFSEYDGLTTVVAAMATHPELFTMLFRAYKCPDTHTLVIGRDNHGNHGLEDGKKVSQLMHYLMAQAMGPGSGEWFGRLCDHKEPGVNHDGVATDMLMIGDFGKDQDDEKALIMATVMRRTGLIGEMTVVANLGDNYMRARLAKGTLNALGAHDVRVAKGSDGGQANEEIHDYEFAHVPYLAPESELDERGGHELIFAALSEARKKSHKITIVLNSALTDMAMVLRDERWDAVAPGVVSHIVLMGGIARVEQDKIAIDESAANNAFDLKSSRFVYERLLADDRFEVIVVTRHAASACQLPKKAIDGSSHPIAHRLAAVKKPSLQKLWWRSHQTMAQRTKARDPLPERCDPSWFRKTYLEPTAPSSLGADDDVWPYIKGFNEYDGLSTVVAATATFPELFQKFFRPYVCPFSRLTVIGLTPDYKWNDVGTSPPPDGLPIANPDELSQALSELVSSGKRTEMKDAQFLTLGIKDLKVGQSYLKVGDRYFQSAADALGIIDSTKTSELLHDLLVTAFSSSRFRKGFKVEVRVSPLADKWQLCMLQQPERGQGSDTWLAVVTEPADPLLPGGWILPAIPVYLGRSTEGVLWRLAHSLGDRDEPILSDLKLGIRYRRVQGVVAAPYFVTQGAWNYLRTGFTPHQGDVWVTGFACSGNMMMQTLVRTLLHEGDLAAVAEAKYACGIISPVDFDVSRGKIDLEYLDALPKTSRVFTTYHSPANMPVKGAAHGKLPPGVKVIHIIRDPRDSCIALFNQTVDLAKCEFTPDFVDLYTQEGARMPWGGWLQQNLDWWETYQASLEQPGEAQVLWITFEECKHTPECAARKVANFLGMRLTEETIAKAAKAMLIDEMRKALKQCPKLKMGTDKTGKALETFADEPEQLAVFDEHLVQPARAKGMLFHVADGPLPRSDSIEPPDAAPPFKAKVSSSSGVTFAAPPPPAKAVADKAREELTADSERIKAELGAANAEASSSERGAATSPVSATP